ncbi:MAG TPA: HTTM domain-containing protein, partial [Myxococcota bacterium]
LFLPLGARFSVDERAATPPDAHESVAAAALTIQIAMVYLFTGLLKLPDASWRNLTAVYFAVNAEHHATYFGLWLGRSLAVTQALSFATLVLELCLPWLLFIPLARDRVRLALIAIFVAFHVGTACCLHLGYFPWVSALAWLVFLPASFWERARSLTRAGVDDERHPFIAAAAALACFVVLLSNVATVMPGAKLPQPVQRLARLLSLEQHWVMFIRPLHNGWFVAPATLGTGDVVDVLHQGAPLSWEKPVHGADQFPNMRWRKFITDLAWERPQSLKNRALFVREICNTWNDNIGDSDQRMVSVDLVFVEEDRDTGGAYLPQSRKTLAHRDCVAERDDTSDAAPFYAQKPSPPAGAP